MLTPELEQLINYALADGVVTPQERAVLMRKAQEAGADMDEFEMILEAKIVEAQKAAAAAAAAAAPKKSSNKHGEMRKCPACGATVSAFSTTCSECGHEFAGIEAVQSASTLFEKLQSLQMEKAAELGRLNEKRTKALNDLSERHNSGGVLKTLVASKDRQDEEREDLIRTFEREARQIERKFLDAKVNMIKVYTVPNTKNDLLELLSMASSNAYDNDGVVGPEEEAWLQKTDQIYQKLVICAAGDDMTLNQATNMIVSLIKRLPKSYKNFTRIPKDLRDRVNVELKAQAQESKEEFKKAAISILTGWRGIALAICVVLLVVGLIANVQALAAIGLLGAVVMGKLTWSAIDAAKNDPLY